MKTNKKDKVKKQLLSKQNKPIRHYATNTTSKCFYKKHESFKNRTKESVTYLSLSSMKVASACKDFACISETRIECAYSIKKTWLSAFACEFN